MINKLLISAKDFASELTSHNVIRNDLKGKKVSKENMKNNKAVRDMLLHQGIKPETLRPDEDIKKVSGKK